MRSAHRSKVRKWSIHISVVDFVEHGGLKQPKNLHKRGHGISAGGRQKKRAEVMREKGSMRLKAEINNRDAIVIAGEIGGSASP